ncbi:tail-collar fiber protein [Pseudomonas sp. 29]|jgi:phage-related tail fiber protein|uniref:phage tail protein n=1 Tax=Pseudomonas sp. 29 TaxID=2035197 RepID=UPI000C505370|nr:phage tail protein [Pseudomonas sp. 29]PIF51508.1 tail-collar fiber protein [Pseudomonas sp. 29]
MADYYTLLTNAGIAYETACKAAGTPIKLTQISVGDGGGTVYNPAATATALKREVWRGPLNALFQDEKNPSWLLAEVTIPPDVGGWYVREAGLWTDTGILYAIVKYPESFKPVLATSGSGKEFYIRSIFETSNASLVTLLIDDTVVKATRAWVMSYLAEELGKLDGKQSVRVAATGNVVLTGAQQIDGVAVIAGDRVLLPSQTFAKDNGLWIVANGDWVRATDANSNAKVTPGLTVMVEEGTANGDSLWHLTTNAPVILGTTALTFKMLAGRTGIAAGTYKSLTVDEYGRATAGANPATLAGFGITDALGINATAVAARKLETARSIAISGAASGSTSFDGSANANISLALADSGVSAGTYTKIAVNAKGLATSGGNLIASDVPALDWSKISSGKPNTLAGYGIVDSYTQGQTNSVVSTSFANFSAASLQVPAFINGFTDNHSSRYWRANGNIYVCLDVARWVSSGTDALVMFTLPPGFRPLSRVSGAGGWATSGQLGFGLLSWRAETTGEVVLDYSIGSASGVSGYRCQFSFCVQAA